MERTELAEEKGMERSVSMRAEDGSSSSTMKMVAEAKILEAEPEEKVVEGFALAKKQDTTVEGLTKGKESMRVDERDKEHDSSREKKVTETERSVSKAEDETSSSSWMQMVEEAKALRTIEEIMEVVEGSTLAEEQVGSSSSSNVLGKLPRLEHPGPSRKMTHLMKDKESMGVVVETHSVRLNFKTVKGIASNYIGRINDQPNKPNKLRDDSSSSVAKKSSVVKKQRILGDDDKERWMRMRSDRERWMRPSIYRVPDWLKSMTKAEVYRPQVVSLGPFHHGEPSLGPMEEQKRRLMLHMVERSKKPRAMFVEAITEVADKLQDAYYDLDVGWRAHNEARFVDVMVTDGGFLLELMTTLRFLTGITSEHGVLLEAGYAPYDPIFSERSLLSLWPLIRSDMILVENQVPLLALKKLEAVRRGRSPTDAYINQLVTDFICPNPLEIRNQEILGLHTLEMFHKNFCGGHSQPLNKARGQSETTMLSAEELLEAGIRFKRSDTRSVQDIDFKNGVLSMPLVEIVGSSERTFFNLMAFERLHSNAGNVATAYMIFMDNIIDSERDVALLRSKKVLKTFLSSDKAAADLFNTLGKGAATLKSGSQVGHVQWLVAKYCETACPKLQASFKHTYLRNPWVFFSAVAGITLLALTILQTVYTVVPFYTKN